MPFSLSRLRLFLLLVLAGLVAALLPTLPARAAAPAYLSGPDVSHWQHPAPSKKPPAPIFWDQVRSPGNQTFAISKATEDVTFTDPYFAPDYAAERAQGLIRGSYHFDRPKLPFSTAVAQADYYASTIGSVQEAGDLPPIMDFLVSGGLSAR